MTTQETLGTMTVAPAVPRYSAMMSVSAVEMLACERLREQVEGSK